MKNIYVCIPHGDGGAGWKEGRIFSSKNEVTVGGNREIANVAWPNDPETGLGMWADAIREATNNEIMAYNEGIRNVKDICSYQIF